MLVAVCLCKRLVHASAKIAAYAFDMQHMCLLTAGALHVVLGCVASAPLTVAFYVNLYASTSILLLSLQLRCCFCAMSLIKEELLPVATYTAADNTCEE